jgi:hypothetical protein
MARTAVVAGTATAVSNRVSRRQAGRWAEQDQAQQQQYEQQQYQNQPPAYAAPEPVSMDQKMANLKSLGEMKAQGLLTDAEFEQQKAAILNS